ncbi:MAG: hypothetical protein WCN92_09430 [Eubacteriales bacterium]
MLFIDDIDHSGISLYELINRGWPLLITFFVGSFLFKKYDFSKQDKKSLMEYLQKVDFRINSYFQKFSSIGNGIQISMENFPTTQEINSFVVDINKKLNINRPIFYLKKYEQCVSPYFVDRFIYHKIQDLLDKYQEIDQASNNINLKGTQFHSTMNKISNDISKMSNIVVKHPQKAKRLMLMELKNTSNTSLNIIKFYINVFKAKIQLFFRKH